VERLDHGYRPAGRHRALIPIAPARIRWHEGRPRAESFNDIYFSGDGMAETRRVFIEPSGIVARARQHSHVCVAELGFGTGMNFAVCAEQILQETSARLHYVSFEKYPLRAEDWRQVFGAYAGKLPIYEALQLQPLPVLSGWHQRVLAGGRVTLQVYHGDVLDGMQDLAQRQANPVDTWFLDGFAPAKNPHMWQPDIYPLLARMAHAHTTVATFTAAGHVRRSLNDAGFVMRKVDQQPFKRESLAGHFAGPAHRGGPSAPASVQVHGAGIAGASVARHLAEAGIPVQVFDPAGIAGGASGIGASMLHARLLGDGSGQAVLRCSAFHYAACYLHRYAGVTASGVLQVQGPNVNAAKLERIATAYGAGDPVQQHWIHRVSESEARAISGAPVTGDALHFPSACAVNAADLCAGLLDHPAIDFQETAHFDDQACNVVCAATQSRGFPGCELLEIAELHGQLDWYRSPQPMARLPIVGNGYLIPTREGCVVGATYEYNPWPAERATAYNRELNAHLLGGTPLEWSRRARGARCVTSDRTPIVGRLDGGQQAEGALWLAAGLGSMGITAGPLAGAMIAAQIGGWLAPTDPYAEALMRPQRFAERQARRGIRHIEPLG